MISSSTGRLAELLSNLHFCRRQAKEESLKLVQAQERLSSCLEAQKLLQQVAEHIQNLAHLQISSIVTRCLKAIFGEDSYSFKIIFEQKRGKTEARLVFVKEDQELDPLEDSAGGMIDVAAFGLRLACLILTKPAPRRLLVLDESFRHVSSNYHDLIAELLETLSEELSVQIILITHSEGLRIGKVVEL